MSENAINFSSNKAVERAEHTGEKDIKTASKPRNCDGSGICVDLVTTWRKYGMPKELKAETNWF